MNKLRFLLLLTVATLGLPAFSSAAGLEGVEWTLTELNGKALAAPAGGRGAPTLQFDGGKKGVQGSTGVNGYFGKYKKEGEKLKFGMIGMTEMAGPPEAMAIESAFHTMLASVTGWRIADGALALLKDDKVVGKFAGGPLPKK